MGALFGRLAAQTMLRPWAERLCDLLQPGHEERVLDAPCDGGALASALARLRPGMRGVALDDDAGAVGECARAMAARSIAVVRGRTDSTAPLRAGTFDAVASLLTLAHRPDPGSTLAALAAPLRHGGRLAVCVWGARAAVPHLAALAATLHALRGAGSPFCEAALSLGEGDALVGLARDAGLPAGSRVDRLRDVVRFDGVDHLWGALCGDGALAAELGEVAAEDAAAARADLAMRLSPVTAPDGTLVIPCECAVLTVGIG